MITLKISKINPDGSEGTQRVIGLPMAMADLDMTLMDMKIDRENDFKYSLSFINSPYPQMTECIKDSQNIDELNFMANFFTRLGEEDHEKLKGLIDAFKPGSEKELINLMINIKSYELYGGASNYAELGKALVEKYEGIKTDSPLGCAVDYKIYGSNFHESTHGKGRFIQENYVICSELRHTYDGKFLPHVDDGSGTFMPCRIACAVMSESNTQKEDGVWINLPASRYTLERAAHKLGASDINECIISDSIGNNLRSVSTGISYLKHPVTEINDLFYVLQGFNHVQMDKFNAAVDYEGLESEPGGTALPIYEQLNLACNLDCYDYNPSIYALHLYADHLKSKGINLPADNQKTFVENMLEECGGKITNFGLVIRNDKPMTEVYESSQNQGMSLDM